MPNSIKKIDIWTVTSCNSKKDLKNWIKTILFDGFFHDMKDEVAKKWKTEAAFINDLADKLIDGTIPIDESWEDGEDAINIESAAYDLASGYFGTQMRDIASTLSFNANGQPSASNIKEPEIQDFCNSLETKLAELKDWISANFPGGLSNNDNGYFSQEIDDLKQSIEDALA